MKISQGCTISTMLCLVFKSEIKISTSMYFQEGKSKVLSTKNH